MDGSSGPQTTLRTVGREIPGAKKDSALDQLSFLIVPRQDSIPNSVSSPPRPSRAGVGT